MDETKKSLALRVLTKRGVLAAWCVASLSCSPERAPSHVPSVAGAIASAPETHEPLPSSAAAPVVAAPAASAAAAAAAASALPVTVPPVPAECRGKDIDLDALFATKPGELTRGPCYVRGPESELAAFGGADGIELTVDLQPKTVASGGRVKITATFKNVSLAPRTILFVRPCEGPLMSAQLFTSAKERGDLMPTDLGCGKSGGCMVRSATVELEPGGVARATGEYKALMRKLDLDQCAERPVGAVKKGSYELEVSTPLRFFEDAGARSSKPRTARVPLEIGR